VFTGLPSDQPLSPLYSFNEPGQPILLYDGPIGGLAAVDVMGAVELSCTPRPSIDWNVAAKTPPQFANSPAVTLALRRPTGDMKLPGVPRGIDGGWSNGGTFGSADRPLRRIIAHWFNLPNWYGSIRLTSATENGGQRWWSGRWVTEIDGWKITIDVRPDHGQIWTDLHKSDVYVMTHVMEICRIDESEFTAAQAEPLLTALHVGISFALGRWAAPMLPVGEDHAGNALWGDWRAYHCDPPQDTSPGWWYEKDHQTLEDLLGRVIRAFKNPDRRAALRIQMMFAIMTINGRRFVEQRVMNCAAGLEHLMWQTLVLRGLLTENQYKGWDRYQGEKLHAHDLLRRVLTDAKIPTDIDPSLMPVIAKFAAEQGLHQRRTLDGADVVTQIRNRLVHPKGAQEDVYRLNGLVAEVWLLARHYLVLLILHSLGYCGPYRDLRRTNGWASDVGKVPWALPLSIPEPGTEQQSSGAAALPAY
jgi:hypothetical protein